MGRRSTQRLVTLALEALDKAAYLSRTERVDTLEVKLAIAALWCVLEDRASLRAYWAKAQTVSGRPWESCREPYYLIAQALRQAGWDAPV